MQNTQLTCFDGMDNLTGLTGVLATEYRPAVGGLPGFPNETEIFFPDDPPRLEFMDREIFFFSAGSLLTNPPSDLRLSPV